MSFILEEECSQKAEILPKHPPKGNVWAGMSNIGPDYQSSHVPRQRYYNKIPFISARNVCLLPLSHSFTLMAADCTRSTIQSICKSHYKPFFTSNSTTWLKSPANCLNLTSIEKVRNYKELFVRKAQETKHGWTQSRDEDILEALWWLGNSTSQKISAESIPNQLQDISAMNAFVSCVQNCESNLPTSLLTF